MRAAILGLAATLMAGQASAADYLRGSSWEGPPPVRAYDWSGFYIGGQVGYAQSTATLSRANQLNSLFTSPWPALPRSHGTGATYGGLAGYNAQWGQVVLGIEGHYNAARLEAQSLMPLDPNNEFVGTTRLTDYGSLRVRAGYAWDWVMPYVAVGVAIGRADVTRSRSPMTAAYPVTDRETGVVLLGYSAGAGVDIGIATNIFLRAEYEYTEFPESNGVAAYINAVRTALAVKF